MSRTVRGPDHPDATKGSAFGEQLPESGIILRIIEFVGVSGRFKSLYLAQE